MDFNLQRDAEMLRRMVNEFPFGYSSYYPQIFNPHFYERFFDDPLFELFFTEHNGRPRMGNTRHARNLARTMVLLEHLVNNQVSQRREGGHNNLRRSRINITLQPSANQTAPHVQMESPDTNPVCEWNEGGASTNDIEICTICREKFKEKDTIRQLPCEHLFHPDCLRPWLQRRNTCPTCRRHL